MPYEYQKGEGVGLPANAGTGVNLPGLSRLPAALRSNGDPVEKNPFAKNDLRHEVWADATRIAEEKVCRLNSKFLKARPTLNPETLSLKTYVAWSIALTLEKFNIWAVRGIQVVWSDAAVRAYDQWLVNYAESWLESNRKACLFFIPADDLLTELRLGLIERVEHWKSEGRRYIAEQRVHAEATDRGAGPVVDGVSRTAQHAGNGSPGSKDAPTAESGPAKIPLDRRAAVDAHIQRVFQRTGNRITRTEIWKSAGYKSRTEFERWERRDARATKSADRTFSRILAESSS